MLRTDDIIIIPNQAQNIPAWVQIIDNWHRVIFPSEEGRGQMKYLHRRGRACQQYEIDHAKGKKVKSVGE